MSFRNNTNSRIALLSLALLFFSLGINWVEIRDYRWSQVSNNYVQDSFERVDAFDSFQLEINDFGFPIWFVVCVGIIGVALSLPSVRKSLGESLMSSFGLVAFSTVFVSILFVLQSTEHSIFKNKDVYTCNYGPWVAMAGLVLGMLHIIRAPKMEEEIDVVFD